MGRIAAGQDFGQAVARPTRYNESATPRAAFGVAGPIIDAGRQLEAQAVQAENVARIEQERAFREAQREAEAQRRAADQATAGARGGVLRERLAATVRELDAGLQDGTIDKTRAGQEWKDRSARIIEEGLPEIPESHRSLIQQDLQARAESMSSLVGEAVKRRDRSDTLAGVNQSIEAAQRQAMTDPVGARAVLEGALSLAPAAGLSPEQIGKVRQNWIETTAYTRAFTAVQQARGDNKALGAVEQALAADNDIDPQRKAQLAAQIENHRAANEARAIRAAQKAEIEAQRRQRESDSAFNVLASWMAAGKMPNPDANAVLIGKLTPEAAAAYRAMAAEVPAQAAAAMLPLDEQQRQLDALVARRNATGTSKPLEDEIARREKVLDAAKRDYAADPLRAAAERGVIEAVAPLDLSSFDTAAAGLAARVQQAQAVATRTKRPVSPLTADEARGMADMLAVLPVKDRALRIAQIGQVLPQDQAQALAEQVSPKSPAMALQLAYGTAKTTSGKLVSEYIGRGAAAKADGTSTKGEKAPDVKAANWKATAAAELADLFPNPKVGARVTDAAELIMHAIAAENGGRLSKDDMQRAVVLAVGGDIVEHNDRRIPLPAGMTRRDLEKRLQAVTPTEIAAPGDVVRAGGVEIPVAEFVKTLPGQQLTPVKPGVYAVMVSGRPVVKRDGSLVTIGVR